MARQLRVRSYFLSVCGRGRHHLSGHYCGVGRYSAGRSYLTGFLFREYCIVACLAC